jgi:hypothetical protein
MNVFSSRRKAVATAVLVLAAACAAAIAREQTTALAALTRPYREWSISDAVGILTDSPWARKETFTRVIGGIGSGVAGEKEIYSTFFVRFLSALPVRQAYARVQLIRSESARLDPQSRRQLEDALGPGLTLDMSRWIVIAVSFRSNDQNIELAVRRAMEIQTTESMKTRAYLSTPRRTQVPIVAFFPAVEEAVGAKLVFPRTVDSVPLVQPDDENLTLELDMPGFDPDVRIQFPVAAMIQGGEVVL